MREYSVNIIGLRNAVHSFQYELNDQFFEHFESGLVSTGNFQVDVVLDKRETFIDAAFAIKGVAGLICDRSLEPFDYPIEVDKHIVFKYGDRDEEISDDVVMIKRETEKLDLSQYMYEFISLEVPMKKLHPRFREEPDDDSEGKIIYSSGTSPDKGDQETDPRWDQLKKLK